MNQSIQEKIKLTEEMNKVLNVFFPHVTKIEYKVFANVNHDSWINEYLVATYETGEIRAVNCSKCSKATVGAEIGHLASITQNYAEDPFGQTADYLDLLELCKDSPDPKYKQKLLN